MASITHPPVTFSDLLRSSKNGVYGLPLKTLGKAHLGAKKRDFTISSALRKIKKHDYPWTLNPDPNVKGGVLTHLSHFKPLKEKPKPVTLEFEKPLMTLQKKIFDVQKMANETGLDFTEQIISLEQKYIQALKDLYTHLTPIQRVNIARHPNRPTFLDHVFNITEKFVELHGDRAGYDDPAIVTGLGTINGKTYMFMGHQKGRNTKENIQRNFGMPTPHGYRKALRMMYYADHHGFPIVTFIDTPGAYADLKSEELNQGEAIANNLRTMFGLKVPIISIVIGEGGSGGALAIGCANKLLMLENAVFYVASPEACAAILWKTAKAAPKAAEKLKITAPELCKLNVCDGIIPEPLGGAHSDPYWTSQQIKTAIIEHMDELDKMDIPSLLKHRNLKFRHIGGFQEGIPIDPERKRHMVHKQEPIFHPEKATQIELNAEIQKVKEKILKAQVSSSNDPKLNLHHKIEKLQQEIDHEYSLAAKSLGLDVKIATLKIEVAKSPDNDAVKEKIEKVNEEFLRKLPEASNYATLRFKLDLLKELVKTEKASVLKMEVNKKLKEVLERDEIKSRYEKLTAEIKSSGVHSIEELDDELKKRIVEFKDEIEMESENVLKSCGLNIVGREVKEKIEGFNKEINNVMENKLTSDLKEKIYKVKNLINKGDESSLDEETKREIQTLVNEIKERLVETVDVPELKEKHEKLLTELTDEESSGGSNGSLTKVTEEVKAKA